MIDGISNLVAFVGSSTQINSFKQKVHYHWMFSNRVPQYKTLERFQMQCFEIFTWDSQGYEQLGKLL